MEKIIMNRGFGKTHQLIVRSAESGDYIVCQSLYEASRIKSIAGEMKCDIPLPITYDDFISGGYYGRNISGFLIDNVDMLLNRMSMVPINAITLTI